MGVRGLLNGVSIDVLFPSQRAQQMTRQTFGTALTLCRAAGIDSEEAVTACVASRFCHSFIKSWCGFTRGADATGHSDFPPRKFIRMSLPRLRHFINSITRGRDVEKKVDL